MKLQFFACLALFALGCSASTPTLPDAGADGDVDPADASDAGDGTLDDADLPDGSLPDASEPDASLPDAGPACTVPSGTTDGCCPSLGNANNDVDCAPVCGNGVLEATELCDTGVIGMGPGACPIACQPTNGCDVATLVSTACQAQCTHTPISAPSGMVLDSCCPSGANANTDADCMAMCGNGVREGTELCDTTAIGADACPLACPPRMACELGTLGGSACSTQCVYAAIATPSGVVMDGCCPALASANSDADCQAVCGNGVHEAGEVCDTAIIQGALGACPAACTPQNSCDAAVMTGSACTSVCTHTPITAASGANVDGCCPSGLDARTDIDCGPVCGNVVLEIGEVCDRAASTADATCEAMCQDFKCRGERYDVNGLTSDGCEVSDTRNGNHSQATAYEIGDYTCVDALSTFSIQGVLPRDQRVHHMPAIAGFDTTTASAPDWYRVLGTGGTCFNDVAATLQVPSGGACFRLSVITNVGTLTCNTDVNGQCSVAGGSGSYSDGTYLHYRIERTCTAPTTPHLGTFTISSHL